MTAFVFVYFSIYAKSFGGNKIMKLDPSVRGTTSKPTSSPTSYPNILRTNGQQASSPLESSPQQPSLISGKGKFAVRPFTPILRGSTEADGTSDGGPTPSKRIACVECRQQKVIWPTIIIVIYLTVIGSL